MKIAPLSGDNPPEDVHDAEVEEEVRVNLPTVGERPHVVGEGLELIPDDVLHGTLAKAEIPKVLEGESALLLPIGTWMQECHITPPQNSLLT